MAADGGAPASVIPDVRFLRPAKGERRATYFELFFDLVYVFAITQLSHHLLTNLTWSGAAETALLLVAIYWAWNYTTWMANWFDPEVPAVRLVLVFVMLASLLMAVAVPEGFGDHAMLFAASYCALQIGRNGFVVAVTPAGRFNRNFRQILTWSILSTPLWIGGALADGGARWALWLTALGIDLGGSADAVLAPAMGAHADDRVGDRRRPLRRTLSAVRDHRVGGEHRSHRSDRHRCRPDLVGRRRPRRRLLVVGGAVVALLRAGDDVGGTRRMAADEAPGRVGRDAYTYLHLPIVAGILLTAVGDELVIAHPSDELGTAGALAALGGPGAVPTRVGSVQHPGRPPSALDPHRRRRRAGRLRAAAQPRPAGCSWQQQPQRS